MTNSNACGLHTSHKCHKNLRVKKKKYLKSPEKFFPSKRESEWMNLKVVVGAIHLITEVIDKLGKLGFIKGK